MKIHNPDPNPEDNWHEMIVPIYNTPQTIKEVNEGEYVTFYKQDTPIFKLNREDLEAIKNAQVVLNGLIRVGAVFGEIEMLRDLIKEL
jgi:hypothetical protein